MCVCGVCGERVMMRSDEPLIGGRYFKRELNELAMTSSLITRLSCD